jgi:DNA gyrase subunit A
MDQIAQTIVPIRIQDEMRNSYMDYSMSVIIGRALPDVRDGLKPVHRRILYAMSGMGLVSSKKYSKCAGVVGEVLKLYHPHGDGAVYDALVRMAQPWNLRYMLVDGQGNFGSVDGDPAAAYRYTECRMQKLAEEMLIDIDKETVDFTPNFDGSTEEPDVLPARLPNLLVNGADGIAVGMATKIPPHNLTEIINACIALIGNPDIGIDELLSIVPAPDFPTAGTIYGRKGVRDAYETGRGRIVVRGNAFFEEVRKGRDAIIIDELPYQVNKARLIEQIADLVRDKRLDGISALRDESDRRGMRIVIELKKDAYGEVVLNHLYKHTSLQNTFGVILLAIVNQRPRVLTLKEMLSYYIEHRREVIQRRTRYQLRKAKERAHIVEGYLKALDIIDQVISLIRSSRTVGEAREGLVQQFQFTEIQAGAILEMRLSRLTGMERAKLEDERDELYGLITRYEEILGSEIVLMGVVSDELIDIRARFGDERRTRIVDSRGELSIHDLVPQEDQVVTMSHLGYTKRCRPDEWRMQRRGGTGKKGMNTRSEDFVTSLFIANTHDLLLVFTNTGRVLPLPVYELPESGRGAKGRPIINLVPMRDGERVASVVTVRSLKIVDEGTDEEAEEVEEVEEVEEIETTGPHLLFISRRGIVKRCTLESFKNLRKGGMIAVGIADDDELLAVRLVENDDDQIMLLTKNGQCIRFEQSQVRVMGRPARGNKGIDLTGDDQVADAVLVPRDEEYKLLTVTQRAYGKRTNFSEYPTQNRNGKGVISMKTPEESGRVVGAVQVTDEDQLMLVTDTGRIIRIGVAEVSTYSRNTRGVRMMRLQPNEIIVDMARMEEPEEEDSDEGSEE